MAEAVRPSEQLRRVLDVLTPVRDILRAPVEEPEPPSWCAERGWAPFLLARSDAELADAEEHGLRSRLSEDRTAPRELRELLLAARAACALPRNTALPRELPRTALRRIPARKREQLSVLLGAVTPMAARAERIVDVGAGSGHLARLAAELFARETLAFDRDVSLVENAVSLTQARGRTVGPLDVRFVASDVGRQALELRPTDLAVGLHACGELGDRLVLAAGRAHSDLALISCCLQKIAAPVRAALSRAAGAFSLGKSELGLSNLTAQAQGVEATLGENLRARALRLALRRLLRARGLLVRPGEEMRGVNRRRAQGTFEALASQVLASRGERAPTSAELAFHSENAERDQQVMRRLSLPRNALARLVELAVVLDRAAVLEEHGLSVQVLELFEARVTPRNTLLLASAR